MPRQQRDVAQSSNESVSVIRSWPDPDAGPWLVELTFGVLDGRVQCTGLQLFHRSAAQAVTQDLVRRLPLARLIEEVRKDPPRDLTSLVLPGPFYVVGEMATHNLGLLSPPEIPARLDEEFLGRVAGIYRRSPSKPTTAVAERFGVSQTRAANWVRRARSKGLLPPARHGREQNQED